MITSLIKMLELPNFDRMTTFTIKSESANKFILITNVMDSDYDIITFV